VGTEAFWVPALIAAAGTGAQYVNQSNANKRQQTAEVQAIGNQQNIRGQANAQVKALTDQVENNSPAAIQGKATGDYVNTLRKNAAGSTQGAPASASALAPVVGGSSRYNADTATSQKAVQDYGQTNAQELGALDSAVRQRQNEGLAMQTLSGSLNQLGAQSYTQNFADQLRAQAAGQANPWVSLFSQMAKNYGTSKMSAGSDGWTPKVGDSAPPASLTNTIGNFNG
jgi:hypothetical protein